MKQIPMLFSTAMIEALLAGRKTETRRVVPGPTKNGILARSHYPAQVDGSWLWCAREGIPDDGVIDESIKKARTQVGDLIWVKESHYAFGWWKTTDELTNKMQKPKRQFVRSGENSVRFQAPAYVMAGQPEQRPGW